MTNYERYFGTPQDTAASINRLFVSCNECPILACDTHGKCGTLFDCERRIKNWLESEVSDD